MQKRFENVSDSDELCDVYDGREYRQHQDFLSKPENVSLLLNTDGVGVFRSSTVSLWPLWLVINELPPSVRFVLLEYTVSIHNTTQGPMLCCTFIVS